FVMDDGIVARLASDRFHITTTTGGAARVLAHMEDYRQTEFTDLTCWLTSTTEHWAVIALQGPLARQILTPFVDGTDLSNAALPHMSVVEAAVDGVPARLFRVSFSGEPGYEINVAAGDAAQVWERLLAAVETAGGAAYGTEAMHVLRAEKGYIVVGHDSDGTLTPRDLGLPTGAAKVDFVGKRGMARADLAGSDRYELVGLECVTGVGALEEGAQVTSSQYPAPGTSALGHVTSAYMSPTLGRPIAMAVVRNGRSRLGDILWVPMVDGARQVLLVKPFFHDPEGTRLHG
ncbi:MAG: aminomethyltransferase family protein, partial [Hyphomicrobiaceae bacterium]